LLSLAHWDPVDVAGLRQLLELTPGCPQVKVGLIDGPVDVDHEGLRAASIQPVNRRARQACRNLGSPECRHGTFVAGILVGARGSGAPAIRPGCTLLIQPLFTESATGRPATLRQLASALRETVEAGARVINLSMTALRTTGPAERALTQALDDCARLDVVVVAAAGNEAVVGSSCITRHPCVVPVAASDARGIPLAFSNLGRSISQRDLLAPGENIVSLVPREGSMTLSGTSAAAPFVTGAIALLCSLFPQLRGRDVCDAVVRVGVRRRTVVPPPLDAGMAYAELSARTEDRRGHDEHLGCREG
jgi:subtilisin family serine protease